VPFEDVPTGTSLAHNVEGRRYELSVGGEVASFAAYREDGDIVIFPHTVTAPRFRGNGFAQQVVRFALDDVRHRGKHVVASCWFVAEFIADHEEYGDLVDSGG
jgi:predicted GNAT family acetyltransferase